MIITLSGFRGENRAQHPLNLPETVGTVSLNQNPARGDLRPWKMPLSVASVPAGEHTIYRMGRDVASDTNYWLSWTGVVHAVRGFIADDTTERTYYTGDGFPKWTDNVLGLASAPYPTAWRQLGIPAPASAPMLVASGGVSALTETRFYTYTYISDKGEEGANSAISVMLTCKTDAQISITNLQAAPAGSFGINRIRIYRTQSNGTSSDPFLFLREIASTFNSTTDDNRTLGDVLPTTTWLTPPADMTCLTGLWNGMMAGISGNSVRVCEAYKPYAWPLAYEVIPPNAKPVALATFGQSLLVLTTAKPVLVTGGTPDSLDSQPIEVRQACVSARSVVGFGHGVAWACPDGLAYYGAGGAKMITAGLLTRDDWQALAPSTLVGTMYEGAYLGFYTVGGVIKGFLVDPMNPTGLFFLDLLAQAAYFDEYQDQLYLLDGVSIKKWDAGAAMTTVFRSKLFHSPKPINLACAEIVADTYPVSFKLYADGVLRHACIALEQTPFRLPAGYRAQNWQIELSSMGAVQGCALASSMAELRQV